MSNTENNQCLNCGKTENETPLVPMHYKGKQAWICPACMPVLIHKTEMLSEKLLELSGK